MAMINKIIQAREGFIRDFLFPGLKVERWTPASEWISFPVPPPKHDNPPIKPTMRREGDHHVITVAGHDLVTTEAERLARDISDLVKQARQAEQNASIKPFWKT